MQKADAFSFDLSQEQERWGEEGDEILTEGRHQIHLNRNLDIYGGKVVLEF